MWQYSEIFISSRVQTALPHFSAELLNTEPSHMHCWCIRYPFTHQHIQVPPLAEVLCFKCGNAIEIRGTIMFDFYPRMAHVACSQLPCLAVSILEVIEHSCFTISLFLPTVKSLSNYKWCLKYSLSIFLCWWSLLLASSSPHLDNSGRLKQPLASNISFLQASSTIRSLNMKYQERHIFRHSNTLLRRFSAASFVTNWVQHSNLKWFWLSKHSMI